jgi:outer membrane protein assembly factor BamB
MVSALRSTALRRGALACTALVLTVGLSGCALRTTGATDFSFNPRSGEATFTLHAVGSCDDACTAFLRWRRLGASTWTNGPVRTFPQGEGRLDQTFTASEFDFEGRFEYQACGRQAGWSQYVCAGPDGTPDTTEKFGAPPAGDWPQWRFDDNNSAANSDSFVIAASTVPNLAERWVAPMRQAGSAVVENSVLYVASDGPGGSAGRLTAFPAQCEIKGRTCSTPLWSAQLPGKAADSTPLVSFGEAYVATNVKGASGTTSGRLLAFDVAGRLRYTGETGGAVNAVPHEGASVVVVASDDGRLRAFVGCGPPAGRTCPPQWVSSSFMTPGAGRVTSSPAGPAGVPPVEFSFFVGSPDGHLYALRQFSGGLGWRGAMGAPVHSSPAIANDVVYVGADNGRLSAFFTQGCGGSFACQPLWTFTAGGAITASPALDDPFFPTTVFVGAGNGRLYAVSASCGACSGGGALRWTADTGAPITSSPVVAGELLYVPSGRRLHIFRAAGCGASTCSPLRTLRGTGTVSTPAVANGQVFFTDRFGLRAYGEG